MVALGLAELCQDDSVPLAPLAQERSHEVIDDLLAKKLVFRGAWLDHRVKEGLLEVLWDDDVADFGYRDPNGDRALLELAPVPSWHELQFRR